MQNTTLSEQLKLNTKSNHQQVEKLLVDRIRSIDALDGYVKLLQLFYGYFGGLEDKINQYIEVGILDDYQNRRKSNSLLKDIYDLNGGIPQKAADDDLPEINNQSQAFGALYVIEGSTLGGKVISKMMAKQLKFIDEKGLSFFNGYGDETEKMWNGFKDVLNKELYTPTDVSLSLEAANDTFSKFALWIKNADKQAINIK
ncbi:heme oxygenase [Pedobacter sp. UYEF25]